MNVNVKGSSYKQYIGQTTRLENARLKCIEMEQEWAQKLQINVSTGENVWREQLKEALKTRYQAHGKDILTRNEEKQYWKNKKNILSVDEWYTYLRNKWLTDNEQAILQLAIEWGYPGAVQLGAKIQRDFERQKTRRKN